MTPFRAVCATGAVLLATAGCSAADAGPSGEPRPQAVTTVLEVSNHNWSDMVVYVVRSGVTQRVGTVTSMTTRRIEMPRALVSAGADLRLMADPIGGTQTFRTGPIQVSPGQRIEFNIQNHLAISHYAVWE